MIVHRVQNQEWNGSAAAAVRRERTVSPVIPPFEVFQSEQNGSVLWRGTSPTLEEAKARIRELAAEAPGEFIVMSRRTGQKLVLKCEGVDREIQTAGNVF